MTERRTIERLIFVFDADSGALSAFFDSAKKALRLGGCALCTITHGLTGERSDWKECKEELGVPVEYVHRDEIDADLRRALVGDLPAVVAEAEGRKVQLMDREALERCRGSVADLRGRMVYFASTQGMALPTGERAEAGG